MQTIKTGVVVALLIAVCYGAFIALNTPDPQLPPELQEWANAGGSDDVLEFEVPGSGLTAASPESVLDALTGAAPGFASNGDMASTSTNDLGSASGDALALPTFDQNPSTVPDLPSGPPLLIPTEDNSNASIAREVELPSSPEFPPATALLGSPVSDPLTQNPAADLAVGTNLPAMSPGLPVSPAITSEAPPASSQNASISRELPPDLQSAPAAEPVFPGLSSETGKSNMTPGEGSASAATIPQFSIAREEWLKRATINGELRAALEALSRYYNSPELTHAQHSDLVDILDGLAREVIYSKRHLMLPSHPSTASESVASIAKSYSITPELLAKINGLGKSQALVPGTVLKVIPGPFSAEVSLSRRELTLFVKGMYAGRFGISLGNDPYPPVGKFEVGARQRDRTYFGADTETQIIQGTDPMNPYGGFWLNLGRDVCIHGSPEKISPDLENVGCISLAPLDASDVYDILTVGSQVSITK